MVKLSLTKTKEITMVLWFKMPDGRCAYKPPYTAEEEHDLYQRVNHGPFTRVHPVAKSQSALPQQPQEAKPHSSTLLQADQSSPDHHR